MDFHLGDPVMNTNKKNNIFLILCAALFSILFYNTASAVSQIYNCPPPPPPSPGQPVANYVCNFPKDTMGGWATDLYYLVCDPDGNNYNAISWNWDDSYEITCTSNGAGGLESYHVNCMNGAWKDEQVWFTLTCQHK